MAPSKPPSSNYNAAAAASMPTAPGGSPSDAGATEPSQSATMRADSPQDGALPELLERLGDTVRRPRVAILIAEGFDGEAAEAMYSGLVESGAVPLYVSTHRGKVTSVQGVPLDAEVTLQESPPLLFEALVVPGGKEHITSLCDVAEALDFVKEQHRLAKPILALHDGATLVEKAGLKAPVKPEPSEPGMFVGMHATAADALPDLVQAMALHLHA